MIISLNLLKNHKQINSFTYFHTNNIVLNTIPVFCSYFTNEINNIKDNSLKIIKSYNNKLYHENHYI